MHSKVNHSMGNTEKDFYTVMAQNMERRQGCRLCDPTISPEDRALLREKGAKLWKREEHKRSHPHVNELDLESERTRFTQVSMEHANDQLLEELSSMMLARIESGDNNTRNETINFGSAAKDGCDLTVATDHGSCRNVLLTRERDFPSLARCQPDLIFNSKMQGISRTEGGATDYQAVTQTRFQHLLKARVIFGRGPRRKLALDRMNLKTSDIPLKDLIGTRLGHGLTTLSLSGNFFNSVPISLVNCLPSLKFLNLSKCNLQTESLPSVWNLPSLTRLDLSHNHLTDFPDNDLLAGIPSLQELNLYGNKIFQISCKYIFLDVLRNLRTLDMGYNDLVSLPDELGQIECLRVLIVCNNNLTTIQSSICNMKCLRYINVASNPLTKPPIDICYGGIRSMRRYWQRV